MSSKYKIINSKILHKGFFYLKQINLIHKKHDGNWIEFTDAELLNAEGWLINLERSKIVDVDFDHPSAYAFQHLLPQDTFKIGKEIDGKIQTTHYYYRSEYARAKEYSLGLTEEESKTQKDISENTGQQKHNLSHNSDSTASTKLK